MPAAHAQAEMIVIQLGITAIRMGATMLKQAGQREGMRYDFSKKTDNKHGDPIQQMWDYKPPAETAAHADKEETKTSSPPLKISDRPAPEPDVKTTSAVKSVHATIVRASKTEDAEEDDARTETAREDKPEKKEVSKDNKQNKTEPASSPILMMKM
jgi:hypothetical protein